MSDSLKPLGETYADVLNSPGFSALDKSEKKRIITQLSQNAQDENGKFGKWFGSRINNAIVYITFVICVIILLIGLIVIWSYKEFAAEYWKGAFPILTGALGYMYGKSTNDKK